jgi:alpha-glucosidase
MLLTLRGTPFLYYGDEIGLEEVDLDPATALDLPHRGKSKAENRDRCRTPMPWTPDGGFTAGSATWLPYGDRARNVAEQREDPHSTLRLTRDLIELRRRRADLRTGAYATLPAPDGVWAYRRGERHAVALNLSDTPRTVTGLAGVVLAGSDRERDGDHIPGALALSPWEAVVVEMFPS